jgi:hypothetical protein
MRRRVKSVRRVDRTIARQRGTYDALDGITPPLKRAFYRYREDQSGVSARTIQVAESELSAILKGDNEIIEELQGDAVAKAERELEIHNAAEAKAAEDRAAARQARQLKKRQKLLEPKVDSPARATSNASTSNASTSSTADTASSAAAATAAAAAATTAATAATAAPTGSNIIKIALPKPPGSASNSTFKTPAPVDKSSRQNSAIAQTPATPATVARSTPGMPMMPPTPATPDVAAVLRFAPPSSVKSEPMTEDNDTGDGGDGEKKLSKEERKAAKRAAKAAKKAAREASGGGGDDDDEINIDEIDLMAIDVPVAPPTTNSVGGFKIKIKMSSGSAPAQTAPTPAPPTVKLEALDAPTAVLQPAPPVSQPAPPVPQQAAAVLTPASVPPPPQPSADPAYQAATARVAECEAKLQAAQKALEEDEAKAASAPNPIYAQKLKSKVATTAAARDAAQAELDAARAAVQAFGQQ